jgi:AcrR family transcriptional regulator
VSQAVTAVLVDTRAPDRAPEGVEARAIDAALACIARHGLSKTTIEDIAREAECSRATLYRYFASKQRLVHRVVAAEADRVTRACRDAAADASTLEETVVAVLLVAGRELARHDALQFVSAHEAEILLPHLTFAGGDRFLAGAAAALAPCFERWLGERASRAAEWVARVGLALWLSPTAPVSLDDATALHAYVREFIAPAICPRSVSPTAPAS